MLGWCPKPGFSFTQWSHPRGWRLGRDSGELGLGQPATSPALIWLSLCLAESPGFVCCGGLAPSLLEGVSGFSLALSGYIPKDPLWQGY